MKNMIRYIYYIIFLLSMIFMHCIADYTLQGVLAQMKQKKKWIEQPDYDPIMNMGDYKVALLVHSFMWTFMIFIPIVIFGYVFNTGYWKSETVFVLMITLNVIIHYLVDDLKANKHKISLLTDQSIHILQILLTYLLGIV